VTWVTLYEIRALVAATLLKDTEYFKRTPVPKVVCGLQFEVAESAPDEVAITSSKNGGMVTLKFQKGFNYQIVNEFGYNVAFNVHRDPPDELNVVSLRAKDEPPDDDGKKGKRKDDEIMIVKVEKLVPAEEEGRPPEIHEVEVERTKKSAEGNVITSVEIADALMNSKQHFVIHRTLDDCIPGVDSWKVTDDATDTDTWVEKRAMLGKAWARYFYTDREGDFYTGFRTKEPMGNMTNWQPNMRVCQKCQALVSNNSLTCPYGHQCERG
jgi:hypothetical protein